MDSSIFDYILSPGLLLSRLDSMSESEIIGDLKSCLALLQTEKSKNATFLQSSEDPELVIVTNSDVDGGPAVIPPSSVLRKQAVLQLLILQMASKLDWNLSALNHHVPTPLQHQLLDCLITACEVQEILMDLNEENSMTLVQSLVKNGTLNPKGIFALSLFCSWILRSSAGLPLPLPLGNKINIYSAIPKASLPAVGNNDQGPIQQWITSQEPVALKVLHSLIDCVSGVQVVPEPDAFFIKENKVKAHPESGWQKFSHEDWLSCVLRDVAEYHVVHENYEAATKALSDIDGIRNKSSTIKRLKSRDEGLLKGLQTALLKSKDSQVVPPPFQITSSHDEQRIQKVLEEQKLNVPFYWRLNYELIALFHQLSFASEITAKNIGPRIKSSHPPDFDKSKSYSDLSDMTETEQRKAEVANIFANLEEPKVWTSKLTMSSKLPEHTKTKSPRLKRKNLLLSIFRESKAPRVQKLLHELDKISAASVQINPFMFSDNAFRSYASALMNRKDTGSTGLIYLQKLDQLLSMNPIPEEEVSGMLRVLEGYELESTRGNPVMQFKTVQHAVFAKGVHQSLAGLKTLNEEEKERCHKIFLEMIKFNLIEPTDPVFEDFLACLVNKLDWDFIFTLQVPSWKILQVTRIVLTLVVLINGGTNADADIKKNCHLLMDLMQALSSHTNPPKKVARDVPVTSIHAATRFFKKIEAVDFLVILVSLFSSIFNDLVEDSSLRITHDFTPLVVSASKAPQGVDSEQYLDVIDDLCKNGPVNDVPWIRLRAEVQFARRNFSTALQMYLQSMVVNTNYFVKPVPWTSNPGGGTEREDKVIQKMIKCLSELGYPLYVVAMTQLLSDVDYSIAFKNLEEHRSNDAMDGIYDNIWDVTILEYAVSMHTRRGEYSRRKEALAKIGSLEINTNNNIEILREAANHKRANLLRSLCINFL